MRLCFVCGLARLRIEKVDGRRTEATVSNIEDINRVKYQRHQSSPTLKTSVKFSTKDINQVSFRPMTLRARVGWFGRGSIWLSASVPSDGQEAVSKRGRAYALNLVT